MKISVIIFSLNGGAGKMIVRLANGFSELDHVVDVVVGNCNQSLRSELNQQVNFTSFDANRLYKLIPSLGLYLAKKKPKYILVCGDGISAIVVFLAKLVSPSSRVVIRQANNFSQQWIHRTVPKLRKSILKMFFRWTFPKAHYLVGNSEGVVMDLREKFPILCS